MARITLSYAADRVGIPVRTMSEWRSKGYLPEADAKGEYDEWELIRALLQYHLLQRAGLIG